MSSKDCDTWIVKGNILNQQDKYEEALKACNKAIKIEPENVCAWLVKGQSFTYLKKYDEALKAFNKASEIEPENNSFRILKGLILTLWKKYEEALKVFNKASDIEPEDFIVWYVKGINLALLEKYEEAVKALDKAIKISPDYTQTYIELGELYLKLGNLEGSSKIVKELLKTDENFAPALSLQGKIKIEKQDYFGAVESFEKALSLGYGKPVDFLWQAYASYLNIEFSPSLKIDKKYNEKENIVSIIRKLEKANTLSTKENGEVRGYILYSLGLFYYRIKDFDSAKEKLEECLKLKTPIEKPPSILKFPTFHILPYISFIYNSLKRPFNQNPPSIKKSASKLLENIWTYQIRPSWFDWWSDSPTLCWWKRFIFVVLVESISVLILYPIIQDFETNWNLYYLLIFLLILILISPKIERIKTKEFEIEFKTPPPFEFVISPAIMEKNIKKLEE